MILDFCKIIDYRPNDISHINIAVTHSSYAFENKKKQLENNERYEFLGDAVLELITTEYIFENRMNFAEGKMTRLRAKIVCEENLSTCARHVKLGEFIKLGKGEMQSGGNDRNSILADGLEATIGAIYLDKGYNFTKQFILNYIILPFFETNNTQNFKDYKTLLQEIVQSNNLSSPDYKVTKEKGPDHDKTFFVDVFVDNLKMGFGIGKTKKEAEQEAAKSALDKYEGK